MLFFIVLSMLALVASVYFPEFSGSILAASIVPVATMGMGTRKGNHRLAELDRIYNAIHAAVKAADTSAFLAALSDLERLAKAWFRSAREQKLLYQLMSCSDMPGTAYHGWTPEGKRVKVYFTSSGKWNIEVDGKLVHEEVGNHESIPLLKGCNPYFNPSTKTKATVKRGKGKGAAVKAAKATVKKAAKKATKKATKKAAKK